MKALLLAMDRWTADGTAPPPSRYPRIADGTLVAPDKLQFPEGARRDDVDGRPPRVSRRLRAASSRRRASSRIEPPRIGTAFPILVPQVDADGNGVAGVRMPELAVPLATYTGWNLFNERSGPTDVALEHAGLVSFRCRAPPPIGSGRTIRGPSIDERYRDKDQYIGLVSKAAQALIDQGFLLAEDLAPVLKNAGRHWESGHPGHDDDGAGR